MKLFSGEHFFWLMVSFAFTLFCCNATKYLKTGRAHRLFRFAIFAAVFLNELAWTIYRAMWLDVPWRGNLPLHLCDIAVFSLLIVLAAPRAKLIDFNFFIGFPGAWLANLLPSIGENGEVLRYVAEGRFYLTHACISGVAAYFTIGLGHRCSFKSFLWTYVATMAYAGIAYVINTFLDTNYFFINQPPGFPHWIAELPYWLYVTMFVAFYFVVMLTGYLLQNAVFRCRHRSSETHV
jgi:hypothetical integral membrane protein (TIGR02206 family)